MAELYILGPAEIRNKEGVLEQSFLAGPKRLALLIYLLLHRPHGFHRRDSLLPLFWPEHGQKSARNALSNMLYHIRRTLGSEAIINRGTEEVSIRPENFWSDVLAFEEYLKSGNTEKALDLYRGDLLKGFYIPEASPEFEQWLDQERERFCTLATEGAWALAEKAEQLHEMQAAQKWGRKAAALNPLCDRTHARLMDLLDRTGNRKGALEVYQEFSCRYKKEWESEPPSELVALAEEIQKKGLSASYLNHNSRIVATTALSAGSIAVLPFETLGLEKATAFTDAIHGDILTRLSNVAELRVTSRTSVMKFRNPQRLLPQIARELGVEWVLSGEVQEAKNRIQVSVRLVKAPEDSQVWGESYWKELTADNLFQIQAEITKQIAEALEARLTKEEKCAIEQSHTKDLESYCLHAQGRWSLDQRTEEGIRAAIDYFQQAIARDPDYALAWIGLADALILLYEYGFAEGRAVFPEAEKAAQRALDLGPGVAEVNASLALLHEARREGPAAIKKYKQAIALRPNYAEAHNWLSWTYQLLGNSEEALQSAKRAVELNPLSQEALSNLSLSWLTNGYYEKALREARRIQHIQPDWTTATFYEGVALYHQGKFNEAANVLENLSVPWAGTGPLLTWALAKVGTGDFHKTEALVSLFKDKADAFSEAVIHAAFGMNEEAFRALQKVVDWDYGAVLAIHHLYPNVLGPLRADARFEQVLQKVNRSWGINQLQKPLEKEHKEQSFANGNPVLDTSSVVNLQEKLRGTPEDVHSPSNNSIAVLPFKGTGNQEFLFTDAIHGDILVGLSRIKELQVISRTSVFYYKNTTKGSSEIGKELHVLWLLEGEVSENTENITITVRLLNASTEKQVWANVYRLQLTTENIYRVQKEIIHDILKTLQVQFTSVEKQGAPQNPTKDLNAYRTYTQGRNGLTQRSESGIYQGLDSFQASIELDPDYALAWSGLADALSLLHFYGFPIPKSSPDALAAATKAVNLNPELSEAHVSLGIVYSNQQQGAAALRELEQAVKLASGYAEALIWLGWLNLVLGRSEKALEPAKQATSLDPLAPACRVFLAEIYLANGAYEKALIEARRAREINPEYGLTHFMEGLALYHNGKLKEALVALQEALPLVPAMGAPNQAEVKTALAFTYHALGEHGEAVHIKNLTYTRISPFSLALLQALFGELDEAFQTFTRVQDWGSFSTEQLRYFFPEALAPLRKDKRYQPLIAHINQAWGLLPDGSLP